VAAAIEAGHRVVPVPGASAVLAALSVAGLPVTPFAFLGFLPRKGGARRALLASYRDRPETLVFFESPKRISSALRDLAETLGDRPACVARELTKLHEEVIRGSLGELAEGVGGEVRGEVTIVVGGASVEGGGRDVADLDDAIRERIAAGLSSREIAAELARESGLPRREVYARVVALREEA
jgi:16S rRNA (cytidine1402-2'-O)-methyltransferase